MNLYGFVGKKIARMGEGGINLYAFVGNDGIKKSDYLGLFEVIPVWPRWSGVDGCNDIGATETHRVERPVLKNCSKKAKLKKIYTHVEEVTVTLGVEVKGVSVGVETGHSKSETEEISLDCCSAVRYVYTIKCTCRTGNWWFRPIGTKGWVDCQVISEGIEDADLSKLCPSCE